MSLVQSLLRYLFPDNEEERPDVPDDVCPNCWGRYEYDGKVRSQMRDRMVDVVNHREREAFVQAFVTEHLDGIGLDNSDRVCSQCGKSAKRPLSNFSD